MMMLFLIYFTLAVGISFLCSISEAGLLSLTRGDVAKLRADGKRSGQTLERMKRDLNRPLAAILTLNTIANCYGAAGVGSEAENMWGADGMAYASGALTLCILVFSEIIPKTVGARFAVRLADITAAVVTVMGYITYPFVIVLQAVSKLVGGDEDDKTSREDVGMAVQIGMDDGAIDAEEADAIKNFLEMVSHPVHEVMTPLARADTLDGSRTVGETLTTCPKLPHSRLPVLDGQSVCGVVRRDTVYEHHNVGEDDKPIADIARPMPRVNCNTSIRDALESFEAGASRMVLIEDDAHNPVGVMTTRDVLWNLVGPPETDLY